jgi:hypothetical protein
MSANQTGLPIEQERLIEALSQLPGVHRALADGATDSVFLICSSSEPEPEVLAAADEAIRQHGAEGVKIQIAYPSPPVPTRRARFLGVKVEHEGAGLSRASVELEWGGKTFTGSAEGEVTGVGEMRSCAQATLMALESMIDGAARFTLIGIKASRIFDTDLVAVLLRSEQATEKQLIGSSLVAEGLHRAASLAVLNATNRLLGNFLHVSD